MPCVPIIKRIEFDEWAPRNFCSKGHYVSPFYKNVCPQCGSSFEVVVSKYSHRTGKWIFKGEETPESERADQEFLAKQKAAAQKTANFILLGIFLVLLIIPSLIIALCHWL